MDNQLLVNLINTSVIKPGTELGILRFGRSMDGNRTAAHKLKTYTAEDKDGNQDVINIEANHIVEVYECGVTDEGLGIIKSHSVIDGKKFIIYANQIKLIDFMLPEKIARVYGYNSDGSKRKQGKKRGRKPKIRE